MTKRRGIPDNLASLASDVASTTIDKDAIHMQIKRIRESLHYDDGTPLNAVDFYDMVRPWDKGAGGAQSTVSRWEKKGTPLPSADDLYRIAQLGGMTMEEMLFGKDREPKKKETTWRDFCRVISDMKNVLDLSVHLDNPDECLNDERDAMCTITFPMRRYTPPSSYDEVYASMMPTSAHGKIGGFLYAMTITQSLPVWEDYKKYSRAMLQDALKRVPDTVPFGFGSFNSPDKK